MNMMIDRYMPDYQFGERHEISIHAEQGTVYRAIREVTAMEIPLLRLLFAIRALPSVLMGKRREALANTLPYVEEMERYGFLLLEEERNWEFVVGVIGKFWRLTGNMPIKLKSADDFNAFVDSRYAKSVMNFSVHEGPHGNAVVRTETRIQTTGSASKVKFALYWAIIYPGSAYIRRMMLKAIKKRAERKRG
ncbi:hypothetical protein GCM10008018_71580 [Paenibacillus marchantiophytorum]|uniref:DUF2867 domain-containing protein n=1 Tax=Paenibacillus marchantiophytorum TaxID=1619310 RepID=A0ABQ1FKB9_9BACL|nr:hypothetical protein [Paenibacillus marchantiophytorum]GGA16843.1 hypothetical protein GCM10008018_71580 [Paenibacillus marchantiophytorum]